MLLARASPAANLPFQEEQNIEKRSVASRHDLPPDAGSNACAEGARPRWACGDLGLHLSAARAYREGRQSAAARMIEIADAAEREWLKQGGHASLGIGAGSPR
jgi:hypothetical protein